METALIEGYAALFDVPDLAGDIIRRGAFRQLRQSGRHPVRMLYQHAVERPVGRWIVMREDEKGLFVWGEMLLDCADAKSIWLLLRGRALDGLSIGFTAAKARKISSGRELLAIDLWEVSIVTFPMAAGARISRVGAATSPADKLRSMTRSLSEGEKVHDH